MNVETVRKSENEKKSFLLKSEKDLITIKKEYDAKIEKLRTDISKLEHEIKLKDDQINGINFSNEKLNSLNLEKVFILLNSYL